MKKAFLFIITLTLLVSCKKDEETEPQVEEPTPVTEPILLEQGSNDESARTEYDRSIGDAMRALESAGFGSRSGVILPCGVVRVDTTAGKYNIVYGDNCGRKKLSGNILASVSPDSAKWRDTGTVVTLNYQNYQVLFEVNGQILTFNGTITITNLNGGLIYETVLLKKVVEHKIRGSLEVTFDDGNKRTWRIFKKRIYQAAGGVVSNLQAEIAADSGNIAEVGINKAGNEFSTTIPENFLYQNCSGSGSWVGPYVLTKGKLVYSAGPNSLTAEPGYTYDNNAMSAVNDCKSSGYKLTWNLNGKTKEQFQFY